MMFLPNASISCSPRNLTLISIWPVLSQLWASFFSIVRRKLESISLKLSVNSPISPLDFIAISWSSCPSATRLAAFDSTDIGPVMLLAIMKHNINIANVDPPVKPEYMMTDTIFSEDNFVAYLRISRSCASSTFFKSTIRLVVVVNTYSGLSPKIPTLRFSLICLRILFTALMLASPSFVRYSFSISSVIWYSNASSNASCPLDTCIHLCISDWLTGLPSATKPIIIVPSIAAISLAMMKFTQAVKGNESAESLIITLASWNVPMMSSIISV